MELNKMRTIVKTCPNDCFLNVVFGMGTVQNVNMNLNQSEIDEYNINLFR